MAKYGAVIIGDNRNVQIDQSNHVSAFIRKQVVSMRGGIINGGEGYYTQLPIEAHKNTKMFAIIPSAGIHVKLLDLGISNGKRNVTLNQPINDRSGTVEVYEFGDYENNIFNEKIGLVVRNPQTRKTVYNSNWGVMNVVDYFIADWRTDFDHNLTNNPNLAFVFGGGMGGIWRDGQEGSWSDSFITREGNVLKVKLMDASLFGTGSTDSDMSYFSSTCIIVDVTNIKKVIK